MVLSKEELQWCQQYWTSVNYLAAASVYLKDNFLLERPLRADDIKDSLLGHWGTCPGINFIYTHLNLIAKKNDQPMLLLTGPGHGFAAILANDYLEGSLQPYYPQFTHDKEGLGNVIKAFCWPEGFPSHLNPGVPGCIHEGGELGYALATAFGAAFDNPDLVVVAIVGDGEAETGPTAAAWHSTKWLNPRRDGAVLPIIHLNGYKISNPTIYGTMSDNELRQLFRGYGYDPIFVDGDHKHMAAAMEKAYKQITKIQTLARKGKPVAKPRWPMMIMRTLKGWTGPKKVDGKIMEGSYRSHQVPAKDCKTNHESLKVLESWLKSYKPEKLFPNGNIPAKTLKYVPTGDLRIGSNPSALGGQVMRPLRLPNPKLFEVKLERRGASWSGSTPVLGAFLKHVFILNADNANFRIFSPDELASNKLDKVLEITGRAYMWPHVADDKTLSPDGRVMEMLSEHTLEGWMQGYTLTGRHGLFPSYEAFLPIIESMASQYLKFLQLSQQYVWRKPVPPLNFLLTSVCWRQDHNGFSHQNPGFINTFLNKAREEKLVRIYLPADANSLLAVGEHILKSTDRVNIIVADKQPIRQWLTYDEAVAQSKTGASIWGFASDEEPDVVLAAAGDYQTQEALATIHLLRTHVPDIKVRFVNVSELGVLGHDEFYGNSLEPQTFEDLFTPDRDVVFSFHGYPGAIKQLLFDRPNNARFHIYGYIEQGTTTTPFDMLVRNNVSRYHLAIRAVTHASKHNPKVARKAEELITLFRTKLAEHKEYIVRRGKDPDEIAKWVWR
jgi:xylulose-5-phosphate/fructose-6-phosphate phosphoketolase